MTQSRKFRLFKLSIFNQQAASAATVSSRFTIKYRSKQKVKRNQEILLYTKSENSLWFRKQYVRKCMQILLLVIWQFAFLTKNNYHLHNLWVSKKPQLELQMQCKEAMNKTFQTYKTLDKICIQRQPTRQSQSTELIAFELKK